MQVKSLQLAGGALHQIHRTLPIPDGGQEKALLLAHPPHGFGAAKTGIGFARTHRRQVAGFGDQGEGRLQPSHQAIHGRGAGCGVSPQ